MGRTATRSAWRVRHVAPSSTEESLSPLGQSSDLNLEVAPAHPWWRVVSGIKLALRTSPSHEAPLTGTILTAGAAFLVSETVVVQAVCADGSSQTFLRCHHSAGSDPSYAYAKNRRSGAAVATRCQAAKAHLATAQALRRAAHVITPTAAQTRLQRFAVQLLLQSALRPNTDITSAHEAERILGRLFEARRADGPWQPAHSDGNDGLVWMMPATSFTTRSGHDDAQGMTMERADLRSEPQSTTARVQAVGSVATACESAPATVPVFECAHGPDAFPPTAAHLLSEQRACVLRGAPLWPTAIAKWGKRSYLTRGLAKVNCQVLLTPRARRDFCYIRSKTMVNLSEEQQALAMLEPSSEAAGGKVEPDAMPVEFTNMAFDAFLAAEKVPSVCAYLQEPLYRPGTSSNLTPTAGLGAQMQQDYQALNWMLLRTMIAHAGLGPYKLTQLFVGLRSTVGARSTLHFDQYPCRGSNSGVAACASFPAHESTVRTLAWTATITSTCSSRAGSASSSSSRATPRASTRTRCTTSSIADRGSTFATHHCAFASAFRDSRRRGATRWS